MKQGIVDVGGGLRGIYGAGVFDYCLDNCIAFDYCIGVSAGSANIASFLAGQKKRNLAFYAEYAFREEYMGLKTRIRKGSYIDLDYVYGVLSNAAGENPLGYRKIVENPAVMKVVASEAVTGDVKYFDKNDMHQDDYGILKASSSIPIACKPYEFNDVLYFDGALSDPIPVKKALADGCEKVVIVLTKPVNYIRSSKKDEKLAKLLKHKYPHAAENLRMRATRYNESLAFAKMLEAQGKVVIIAPDDVTRIKTLTKNKKSLVELYHKGYKDASLIARFL